MVPYEDESSRKMEEVEPEAEIPYQDDALTPKERDECFDM